MKNDYASPSLTHRCQRGGYSKAFLGELSRLVDWLLARKSRDGAPSDCCSL